MKALVYTAPLQIEVREEADPTPAAGEVVLQVAAAGICGSELEGFASQSPMRVPPLVMGHEFCGVRVDTGERVIVNPLIACHTCDLCVRGLPQICRNRAILGIHRAGGFAERVAVPEAACVPAPADMTAIQAAFVEPLANAVHAIRLATVVDPAPLRIGVIGAGPLGYATAAIAKARGIPTICVADTYTDRLSWLEDLGGIEVGSSLQGEFDVIVDAVGAAATRNISVEQVRPGGVAVWLGLHSAESGFDGRSIIRSEKSVVGTFAYTPNDFLAAVHYAKDIPTGWSASVTLDDSAGAFTGLLAGPVPALKTMIQPAENNNWS